MTKELTAQEIFDTVARHLFEQGKAAYDPIRRNCVFWEPSGLMCAAGCVIPNVKAFSVEFLSLSQRAILALPEYLQKEQNLLKSLQNVHDAGSTGGVEHTCNWETTDTMRFALDAVAHEYKLDNSILATLKFKDR